MAISSAAGSNSGEIGQPIPLFIAATTFIMVLNPVYFSKCLQTFYFVYATHMGWYKKPGHIAIQHVIQYL